MRSVVLALAAVVALGSSPVAQAAPSRPCKTRAEGSGPQRQLAAPGDLRIGPVAFLGLARLSDPTEFARQGGPVRGRHLIKTPLRVRAGKVVTVSIDRVDRGTAGLTFARRSPHEGVPAVRFAACRKDVRAWSYDGTVGPVTGFPGGFSVAEPSCVHLTVRERGRARPYRGVASFGAGDC